MSSSTTLVHAMWVIFALAVLAACAGPREAADTREDADELPTPAIRMADFEDFDASPYREEGVGPIAALEHDVPVRLMEGRADEGIRTEVQGFRVQVFTSIDKNAAVAQEEAVKEWLREMNETAGDRVLSENSPIYVVYSQPYYRVRVGNFTTQETAELARRQLARRFQDAFIVPDRVVITR